MSRETSLYRYFDAAGSLLYVGITSRRTGRSLQHASEKAWWSEVARCEWEHFATREEALHRERLAIANEYPKHNVIGRSDRPDDQYRREALMRWPDGMDMAWDGPRGAGRWATVSWCGGMTVALWRDLDRAEDAFCRINDDACGHACRNVGDHELVDLDSPPFLDAWLEQRRLDARLQHFADCRVCEYVYSGQAPEAAHRRHAARIEQARAREAIPS